MTVQDLINKLLDYPSNMRVLTLGYEGGYNDTDLKTDHIVFDINSKDTWCTGMVLRTSSTFPLIS